MKRVSQGRFRKRCDRVKSMSVLSKPSTSLFKPPVCNALSAVMTNFSNITAVPFLNSSDLCLPGYCSLTDKLCNSKPLPSESYSVPSSMSEKAPLVRSVSSSSDEDMIVNSPDSGFESSTPTGRSSAIDFSDDFVEDFSKSSQVSSLAPLCLIPPPPPQPAKPVEIIEPSIACKWQNCTSIFISNSNLQRHVSTDHVEKCERFSCLWLGCRVFDKPARNHSWLRHHVTTHTGQKRFKCMVDGCDAAFSTQMGVARHVPSHFNEMNIPKARVAQSVVRRCLVKRRCIRDTRKALANTHDFIDDRSLEIIRKVLVKRAEQKRSPMILPNKETCRRLTVDGSRWTLNANGSWSRLGYDYSDENLFFFRPTKRTRKYKVPL